MRKKIQKKPINIEQELLEKYEFVLTDIFPIEYHSRGMIGALDYIFCKMINNDWKYRQEDSAIKTDVSIVTIRNNIKRILEEKDLEEIKKIFKNNVGD